MNQRLYLLVLLVVLIASNSAMFVHGQVRVRGVVAAGGGISSDTGFSIHGTASQTAIGRIRRTGGEHLVGFWYSVQRILDKNKGSCLVVLPTQEVFIGTRTTIPLLLQESRNINDQKNPPRRFEVRIRFNATLLEPQNLSNVQRINDDYIITLQGERNGNDSAGVLAEIEFIAKLGNAENTPLVIEDFRWLDNANIITLKKDGEALIGGICRGGDTVRLLHRSKKAMITSVFPQPASEQMTIDLTFNEKGATVVYLTDMNGNTVATLLNEVVTVAARTLVVPLADIASGSYFLMMRTPNELISRKVIVLK